MQDQPSRSTPISLRFIPDAVFVPFLMRPRNAAVAVFHPASPSSVASSPQNSARNSFGSLGISDSGLGERERKPPNDLRCFSLSTFGVVREGDARGGVGARRGGEKVAELIEGDEADGSVGMGG